MFGGNAQRGIASKRVSNRL